MFKDNLFRIRTELGVDQEVLAKILNISPQSISAYEKGARVPTLAGLQIILETLNNHYDLSLTYNDLLEGGVRQAPETLDPNAIKFLNSRKKIPGDSTVDTVFGKISLNKMAKQIKK